jgi:tetratricopeptide (TPR) repeat protein
MDRANCDPETALRLASALPVYWGGTFALAEGCRRLESALDRFPSEPTAIRALGLYRLANLHLGDDVPRAIVLFEASLGISRKIGDIGASAKTLRGLGLAHFYAADYVLAAASVDECVSVALEDGDIGLAASGKGLRTFLYMLAGDYPCATALGNESLEIMRKACSTQHVAGMLRTLGCLAYEVGDYDLYRRHNEEALALDRSVGYEDGAAWCLIDLGRAATDLGQGAMGRELIEEALEITRKLDDRFGIASALETLGQNDLAQGNIEQGRRLFNESLSAFRALGDRNGMARAMDGLGDAASGADADAHYRDALAVWRELKYHKRIRDGFLRIGNGITNLDRSIRLWAYAYRMTETMGAPIPLPMRARHEQAIRAAKGEFGFAASWAAGEEMSLEAALDLALAT